MAVPQAMDTRSPVTMAVGSETHAGLGKERGESRKTRWGFSKSLGAGGEDQLVTVEVILNEN